MGLRDGWIQRHSESLPLIGDAGYDWGYLLAFGKLAALEPIPWALNTDRQWEALRRFRWGYLKPTWMIS